jgi:hypothetical protein
MDHQGERLAPAPGQEVMLHHLVAVRLGGPMELRGGPFAPAPVGRRRPVLGPALGDYVGADVRDFEAPTEEWGLGDLTRRVADLGRSSSDGRGMSGATPGGSRRSRGTA